MELKTLLKIGVLLTLTFASPTVFASPTLSINAKGRDVLILQQQLKKIGYDISELDGIFGAETKRAVEAFQRDQSLSVTGVVNNATWRALKNAQTITRRTADSKIRERDAVEYSDSKLVPLGKVLIDEIQAEELIATAKKYLGVPYVFGGTTPSGFDCSGFIQYVFKQNGLQLPRLADEQYKLGKSVKQKDLRAGDLVFFTTYEPGASHVGIYIGNGQFLHTSSSKGVRVDNLDNVYWAPRYYGGKQIVY